MTKGFDDLKGAKKALLKNGTKKITFCNLNDTFLTAFFEGKKIIMAICTTSKEREEQMMAYFDVEQDVLDIAVNTCKEMYVIKGKNRCKKYIDELEVEED